MPAFHFQPSRRASGAPEIRQMIVEASATIALGEVLQRDSDAEEVEPHAGGATVTGILGVSMGVATAGTAAFDDRIPVAIANLDQEFLGTVWDVSGSAVATAAVGTHEGVSFGVVKVSGQWYVDEEDTTDVVVRVTKVLLDINAVLFKFITSAVVN